MRVSACVIHVILCGERAGFYILMGFDLRGKSFKVGRMIPLLAGVIQKHSRHVGKWLPADHLAAFAV